MALNEAAQTRTPQTAQAAAEQKTKNPSAAQRKKMRDTEEDLQAQIHSEQLVTDPAAGHVPEDTLLAQPDVLYAQASRGSEAVTDAGPGSTSSSVNTTGLTASGITTSGLSDSGLLGLGSLVVVGVAAVANSDSATPTPDTNDKIPPTFSNASITVNVAEITPTSTVVHTATATDNVAVTGYAFFDGGADNDKFTLDVATGALRFKTSPDFETPGSAAGGSVYSVKIQATDATGNIAVQTITVNVTDVNEAPIALALTGALVGSGKNEIAENTATTARLRVADIAITDDALGNNTLILSGADKDQFEIDGNALHLKAGTVLDFEIKPSYAVTVQVHDSTVLGSAVLSQTFELKLTDVDEVAPTALLSAQALANNGNAVVQSSEAMSRV